MGVAQYASCHSPTNFTEPFSFIPEMFEPETDEDVSKLANGNKVVLQLFSVGPRNCVGRTLMSDCAIIQRISSNYAYAEI